MANLKQNVVQFNLLSVPPRMIVQYISEEGEDTQSIVKYEDLTPEEKTTFDAFKELSISKMV